MSVDVRVQQAVREYVDRLPVPPPDLSAVVGAGAAPPPQRRRLLPLAAAFAVGLVLLVAVGPGMVRFGGDAVPGDSPAGRASLPDRIARYSYLTADLSDDPPGPAIALYDQGYGVELFDFPQKLVLAADRDAYRRVDLAERRGDAAPAILAPDGTRVAIGSLRDAGNVLIQDLRTGRMTILESPRWRNLVPVAWSPDGRYLAAMTADLAAIEVVGRLVLFDLNAPRPEPVEIGDSAVVSMAAFSPHSDELAVQSADRLVVIDRSGRVLRTLRLPEGFVLDSPNAWSPDGRLLAVHDRGPTPRVAFVDASGSGQPVPAAFASAFHPPLGWTGPDHLLTWQFDAYHRVLRVDVRTGVGAPITAFDTGPADNYAIGEVHLARNLLLGVSSREAGRPDRGSLAHWLRVVGYGLLAAFVFLVVRALVLRARFKRSTRTLKETGNTGSSSGTTDASGTTWSAVERDDDARR